jgi:HSP20 family protein
VATEQQAQLPVRPSTLAPFNRTGELSMFVRHRNDSWLDNPFSAFGWGSPFDNLDRLRRELDPVFSSEPSAIAKFGFECARPPSTFTLTDNDTHFVLSAQLPGLTEKDLDVTVTAERVTVRGQRPVRTPEGYTKIRQERAPYSFDRSIQLPKRIDSKLVEAKLVDGTLTITLPKAEEVKPNHISVVTA